MKTLFLAPEPPYPAHGGGAIRSACVLEWLAQRSDVYALICRQAGEGADDIHLNDLCRHVEVAELPVHSRNVGPRIWRNLKRAARAVPPLVDRFSGPEVGLALDRLLAKGPFDLAVFEHFWMAPWIHKVRPHCDQAILNLHNREPEFYQAMGGPLAGWFAECAARFERRLLPRFDQVADPHTVPTGLPSSGVESPSTPREFDLAFSGRWDYAPNLEAARWFFDWIWPRICYQRHATRIVLIGKREESIPIDIRRDPFVTVTGETSDAGAWLARSRVAIAPLQRGAGVSVKVAEAWRSGCPVVATSVGARGYDVGEGLSVASTASEFSTEILDLLDDDERWTRMSCDGRRRFERDYSFEAVFERLDRMVGSRVAQVVS